MSQLPFTRLIAGDREAGGRCLHCGRAIARGEEIAACGRCGAAHHLVCWHAQDGCGSFDCAPARRVVGPSSPALRVTAEEVQNVALPVRRPASPGFFVPPPEPRRWSRMAVAAFIVALAGIPLFGLITGLVAIILGSLALGAIRQTRQKGTVLAVLGLLVGLADMAGWLVFLAIMLNRPHGLSIADFEPDAAALDHLPPLKARAVKANVLIEVQRAGGILGGGIGSGVILAIQGDKALIVTNRHVVDAAFALDDSQPAGDGLPDNNLQIKLIGQPLRPGRVVWVAPDRIDLALVAVPVEGQAATTARWQRNRELTLGEDVFAIGNPQHLDWTHTRGSISQLRLQTRGNRKIRVIQTDAPINPGNSGGGLYDKEGVLIGINTWTNDKRFSEGLSFAIGLDALLDLDPPPLRGEAGHEKVDSP